MKRVLPFAIAGLMACTATAALANTTANNSSYEKKTTIIERRSSANPGVGTARTRFTSRISIRQMQEDLRAAGFYSGRIDGRFGPRTSQALKDFQAARGLRVTGRVDAPTQHALMNAG